MKNLSKSFILLGILATVLGICGFIKTETQINKGEQQQEIQAYDYNPSNILDNVFIENNIKYLPFIYNNPNDAYGMTVEYIKEEFQKAGLTVANISTVNYIGTGTTITVNENSNIYTVLIYGDVNGDGSADVLDAYDIALYIKGKHSIAGHFFKAGNVCNFEDNSLDILDAYQIVSFQKLKLNKLVEVEPVPAKEVDKEAPTITLNGSNPLIIEYGSVTSYTDAGILNIQDEYEGTIETSQAIMVYNDVKVNIVNAKNSYYSVKYAVTDIAGNTGYATRQVQVVDNEAPKITIKTDAIKSIVAGEAIPDFTAMASVYDNYDQNLQVTATVSPDITSGAVGEYTVTFMAKDSSENSAEPKYMTFEIIDEVDRIEMQSYPTLIYNYDATQIELNDAKINVYWKSQKTEPIPITNDMLTYTTPIVGKQTVIVTYKGATTSFEIDINKIQVSLENIADYEVRADLVSPLKRALTFTDSNGNNIDVKAKELQINYSDGIKVVKLDANGNEIGTTTVEEQETIVKYIGISTNITQSSEEVESFTLTVNEEKGDYNPITTIQFKIGDKSTLTDVNIGENEKVTISKGNNLLNLHFLNKENNEMKVEASKVKLSKDDINVNDGEVAIILPSGIDVYELYDENGIYEEDNAEITFAKQVALVVNKNLEDADLDGKTITIKWNVGGTTNSKVININVKYNPVANLYITKTGINADSSIERSYNITIGETVYTLGTIESGENQQPLTASMLQHNYTGEGITISFEDNKEDGLVYIKATASTAGIYENIVISLSNNESENEKVTTSINIYALTPNRTIDNVILNSNSKLSDIYINTKYTLDFYTASSIVPVTINPEDVTITVLDENNKETDLIVSTTTSSTTGEIEGFKISNGEQTKIEGATQIKIKFDFGNENIVFKDVTIYPKQTQST